MKVNPSTSYIIIPARLASTRLPRKLLLRETGKTLIQHTYEAASRATRPAGICVATDHAEIFDAVRSFGGQAEMTDPRAASGTDRVAEVARRLTAVEIVVNVQGDEPDLPAESIDLVIQLLEERPGAVMATLATPIRSRRQLQDPACVKVVFDAAGRALYFSRSPIPCARQWDDARWRPSRRISTSTWASTPIAAISCCNWPPMPHSSLEKWRSSNSCGSCRPATRSWSAWSASPPSASTRRRTIGPSWPSSGLQPECTLGRYSLRMNTMLPFWMRSVTW